MSRVHPSASPPVAEADEPPPTSITVTVWPDPVIDLRGHDPRGRYVERFWLPTLGPSATWLLRRLADGLDGAPEGFRLDLDRTAAALGLANKTGRQGPFGRAFLRLAQFGLAREAGAGRLEVRRRVPPLTRRQVERLPAPLPDEHRAWLEAELRSGRQPATRRARALARSMLQVGIDLEHAERHLHRLDVEPGVASDAVRWATAHGDPAAAADEPPPAA